MTMLKNLLLSSTSKDSSFLLGGTILSTGLNFLIIYLLTQNLSVGDFGLFSTAMTFSLVITDIFGFGIGAALLNFLPSSTEAERSKYIKAAFFLRLCIYSIVAAVVYLTSNVLALNIFNNQNIAVYLQIAVIGIFLLSFVHLGQTILQGRYSFFKSSIVSTSKNLFSFLIIGVFLLMGITLASTLYLGYNLALLGSVLVMLYLLRSYFTLPLPAAQYYKSLLKFGLPIGIGFAVAALYTKLDQFFILSLVGEQEAGIYSLAFRIAVIFLLIADAFNSAIVPRFSSLTGVTFTNYFKKTLFAIMCLVLVMLVTIPLQPLLISIIFGPNYLASIIPLRLLTLAMILFTISVPFSSALVYRFKYNHFPLFLAIASLISIYYLLQLLIPTYRSSGAAMSLLIIYGAQLIIAASLFCLKLNKNNS